MNWNKILSVFIVLFLIINLGLYAVRSIRDQRSYTLSSSRTQQLENMMKQKGVTMYDYLPEFYPKAILELKAAEWKKEEILTKIFAGQEYRSEITYQAALADSYQSDSCLPFIREIIAERFTIREKMPAMYRIVRRYLP